MRNYCIDGELLVYQSVKPAGSKKEGGVGLTNVRRRLDLLYGNDYSLRIYEGDQRYSVTLVIPGI